MTIIMIMTKSKYGDSQRAEMADYINWPKILEVIRKDNDRMETETKLFIKAINV